MDMHTQGRRCGALIMLLALAASCVLAQQPLTLRYQFAKGQMLRYADDMTAKSSQEMAGQEMKANVEGRSVHRIVVEGKGGTGAYTLVASTDSMKYHVKSPMMDTTISIAALIGKRTRLHLTELGEIVRRETIDTARLEGMMRGMVGQGTVTFKRLPQEPVRIGQKWKASFMDSTEMQGGKSLTSNEVEYSPVGMEQKLGHDCLKVTYTGTSTITGKGKFSGMDIFTEGTGKTAGTFFFDVKQGVMVQDESTVESDMTMAITGQQNMTIPSSQTVRLVHTLVRE